MYGSETMLWKERSRIRAVHIDNLRGLLSIRRIEGWEMSGSGLAHRVSAPQGFQPQTSDALGSPPNGSILDIAPSLPRVCCGC